MEENILVNKHAFIFPGQGSQFVGMGQDLFDTYAEARHIFAQADQIMGFDLSRICFRGPEDELKQTRLTQPAIFVHSMVVYELLKKKGFVPGAVAGHSLGEYSALVAAGALSFENGLKLVKIRGELMQQAGEKNPGSMAALIGLEFNQVQQVCAEVRDHGIVCTANFNSPGQVVISGQLPAVRAAMAEAKKKGAKKVMELVVSGAFHSPLMENAQQGLAAALRAIEIKDADVPVYTNVQAVACRDKNEIRDLLYKQLTHPVRWVEIIQNMIADGFTQFYEIGPGKVLSGLVKRINSMAICQAIGDGSDLGTIT